MMPRILLLAAALALAGGPPAAAGEPVGRFPAAGQPWEARRFLGDDVRAAYVKLDQPQSGPFTLVAWIKIDEFIEGEGDEVVFSDTTPAFVAAVMGGDKQWINILTVQNKRLRGGLMRDGAWGSVRSDTELAAGRWFHVALTQDAQGRCVLYLDGKEDASSVRKVQSDEAAGLTVGGVGRRLLRGEVRQMALFSTALDAGTIAALAKADNADEFDRVVGQ